MRSRPLLFVISLETPRCIPVLPCVRCDHVLFCSLFRLPSASTRPSRRCPVRSRPLLFVIYDGMERIGQSVGKCPVRSRPLLFVIIGTQQPAYITASCPVRSRPLLFVIFRALLQIVPVLPVSGAITSSSVRYLKVVEDECSDGTVSGAITSSSVRYSAIASPDADGGRSVRCDHVLFCSLLTRRVLPATQPPRCPVRSRPLLFVI